ncbi:DUF2231 domain-containing protein [Flexivirga alba]|uniref:DUF2231 domain-containing protein n=1 Tax=Flexivirga alba TaxID=702742 RepID=A0ABW2AIZ7_9MICO
MNAPEKAPLLVRWMLQLEQSKALDTPVRAFEPKVRSIFGSGARGSVLRGDWLGHSLHPVLTDIALGTWTSASLLDLTGGPQSSAAAQRLVGAGLLAAGPTAWTGWAEWSAAAPNAKRVGLVHAATNGAAISIYAASWIARRRGRHTSGVRLAVAGAAISTVGGYLGGHLAQGRKVGSRHSAFDGNDRNHA